MKTTIKILAFTALFLMLPESILAQARLKSKEVVNRNVRMSDAQPMDAFPEELLSEKVRNAQKVGNTDQAAVTDGIVYSIIASANTTLDDCFSCGPAVNREPTCIAKYTVETRNYTEWRRGVVVRVWTNRVSVFMGCGRW